jgi:hypothetical protein
MTYFLKGLVRKVDHLFKYVLVPLARGPVASRQAVIGKCTPVARVVTTAGS